MTRVIWMNVRTLSSVTLLPGLGLFMTTVTWLVLATLLFAVATSPWISGLVLIRERQVVGDRNVRIVPDVAVNGSGGASGLAEGLLGLLLRREAAGMHPTSPEAGTKSG
jgi:hypothetical protein